MAKLNALNIQMKFVKELHKMFTEYTNTKFQIRQYTEEKRKKEQKKKKIKTKS